MEIDAKNTSLAFEENLMKLHERGESSPVLLDEWLKHDTWSEEEGFFILLGLNPNDCFCMGNDEEFRIISARYLDFSLVDIDGWDNSQTILNEMRSNPSRVIYSDKVPITSYLLIDLSSRFSRMKKIWASGTHAERNEPSYYIEWAKSKGFDIPWYESMTNITCGKSTVSMQEARNHHSDWLMLTIQASNKFWSNADPHDSSTHPKNKDVQNWLESKGITETLANKAATLIRPKWAAKGRPADK